MAKYTKNSPGASGIWDDAWMRMSEWHLIVRKWLFNFTSLIPYVPAHGIGCFFLGSSQLLKPKEYVVSLIASSRS